MNETSPRARVARLVIKELPDEVLVYDLDTDKAYCLNQTAALVWKNCDGQQTVAQLRQLMAQETNSAVPEEMVWLALDQLDKFQLLETAPIRPACLAGMKRRELVRSIGVVAMALPLIMSIAAPTAAQGASPCQCTSPNCRPTGCPCSINNDCVHKCEAGICV